MIDQEKQFFSAIKQISDERGIDEKKILNTIESAIAAAYRKDHGKASQKIEAKFDKKTGKITIYQVKKVITDEDLITESGEKRDINSEREITLEQAKKEKKHAQPGDQIKFKLPTKSDYGRIAAQTAKQVIIQKVREAEKTSICQEYKDKEGEIISGIIQRKENNNIYIDLGRTTGVLFPMEQIPGENYKTGQRIKFLIVEVKTDSGSPMIILSRSRPKLLKKMFALEVPEVGSGTVEIKAVAREPGSRSKIAVVSHEEGVDPIGSLVGQKGTRIQTVINEIGGEMIDVVRWTENTKEFISQALSPAKVTKIDIDKQNKTAIAYVPQDQLSLAIGKKGQNVRLAARLTGWKIDVKEESDLKHKSKNSKEAKKIKHTGE